MCHPASALGSSPISAPHTTHHTTGTHHTSRATHHTTPHTSHHTAHSRYTPPSTHHTAGTHHTTRTAHHTPHTIQQVYTKYTPAWCVQAAHRGRTERMRAAEDGTIRGHVTWHVKGDSAVQPRACKHTYLLLEGHHRPRYSCADKRAGGRRSGT